jgi:hypothetical protein
MAGGNSFTKNPQKGKYISAFDNTEVLKAPTNTISSILNGVLRPGETIDFSIEQRKPEKPKFTDYIQKENSLFINQHQEEIEQLIKNTKNEINSLIPITENLNQDIANIPLQNVTEANNYQLNFLQRIKTFITDLRQNASESNSWTDIFNHRKKKRNAFWNQAKSKNGGEQYLMSSEHSASRSAA